MAQVPGGRVRRLRLLAHRYGVTGKKGAALACIVLVVALGAFGYVRLSQSKGTVVERSENEAPSKAADSVSEKAMSAEESTKPEKDGERDDAARSEVWVHVDGAVNKPGVYKVSVSSPRINDAVALAGGLANDANTANVNLAATLSDGQKVYVPHVGEEAPREDQSLEQGNAPSIASDTQSAGGGDALVNINTASESELQTLPGVGEATASAIVEERQSGGPFSSVEDLMRVTGIGEKKFAKVKDKICV